VEQANRPSFSTAGQASPVSITINIDGAGQDPEAIAAFTLRKLKRELEDRGLRLGQ
jgi:hypothetical protein